MNRRAFWGLMAVHAAVTWAVMLSGSAWATTPLECHTGGMAALLRGGYGGSIFDLWHGAMGSHFLIALLLVPFQSGFMNQLLAYAGAAGLVAIAFRLIEGHAGWRAALCGAGALAFGPPVLARSAWALGDWHWTQMLFDYGALLLVLRPRVRWGWLGVVTGLGLANSLGSLPYLGLAWGIALWTSAGRRMLVGGALAVALSTPMWWKLLVHRPFGGGMGADKTASRLSNLSPEPSKLLDFVGPKMAAALHFEGIGWGWIWLVSAWLGVGVLLWGLAQGRGPLLSRIRWRRPPSVELALLAWLGVFLAAYVVLRVRLQADPEMFTNARAASHRMLPPLVGALALCGGVGLARLKGWWLGLVPAAVGLVAQIGLVGGGTVGDYRGACFEPLGYFIGQMLKEPGAAFAVCDSHEVGAESCRVGAAWGVGFSAAEQAHAGLMHDRRGRSVTTMGAEADSAAVCRRVPSGLRAHCLRGFGWHGGAFNWTGRGYPVRACDQLATAEERDGCWVGVGFPLGDHLAPTPERIGFVLDSLDPPLQEPVARGAGYAIGRAWESQSHAASICAAIGPHAPACTEGVAEAFADPR